MYLFINPLTLLFGHSDLEDFKESLKLSTLVTWLILWGTSGTLFFIPVVREFAIILGYTTTFLNKIVIISWILFSIPLLYLLLSQN